MARGLKIAHKENGTLHDQKVSTTISSIGGTGGIPQWVTSTGTKTVKVQYNTSDGIYHANAYIISQKGAKQFLVANAVGAVNGATHSNASITVATLTAGADAANLVAATGASAMTVMGYNTSNTAFYVKRITNKYVWDFSNNRYRWRTSDSVATATFANVICH